MADEQKKLTPEEMKQVGEEYVKVYTDFATKLSHLSRIRARQLVGDRPNNDPRVLYLMELDTLIQVTVSQVEALAEMMARVLGPGITAYMEAAKQAMQAALERMQKAMGVTGWAEDGSPILDLEKFREITANWPK